MKERQKEECTSVASYPTRSGSSSVLENYDHVFDKGSMGYLSEKRVMRINLYLGLCEVGRST